MITVTNKTNKKKRFSQILDYLYIYDYAVSHPNVTSNTITRIIAKWGCGRLFLRKRFFTNVYL